jgi:hypothetical protein
VMNDRFAAVAISVFFSYHGCPISRLTLFNDRGAVSVISVMVVTVAYCNARTRPTRTPTSSAKVGVVIATNAAANRYFCIFSLSIVAPRLDGNTLRQSLFPPCGTMLAARFVLRHGDLAFRRRSPNRGEAALKPMGHFIDDGRPVAWPREMATPANP